MASVAQAVLRGSRDWHCPRPTVYTVQEWNACSDVRTSVLLPIFRRFDLTIGWALTWSSSGILTTWLVKVCTGIYRYIPVYTVIYYATLRKSVFWYEKVYTISYQVWKFRNFSYVVWDGMRKYGYETVWNGMKQYETVWNEMYEVCTSIYWYILSHARISCILWMHIPTHTGTCQHVFSMTRVASSSFKW